MNDTRYMISETARMLQVEPHVLRYWEEELKIQVKRNEMGHRYYTDKDIQTFLRVKELKKSGMQLRAIRKMLDEQGETTEEEVLPTIREERVVPFVRPDSSGLQDTACENYRKGILYGMFEKVWLEEHCLKIVKLMKIRVRKSMCSSKRTSLPASSRKKIGSIRLWNV